jgi:hypothetical protein
LSDKRCATLLDLFWRLLEFDPDEPANKNHAERDDPNEIKTETVQFHVDVNKNSDRQEDEQLAKLLRHKVDLLKTLIEAVIDHSDPESRILVEHARRLISYAQSCYFRHLRLYDFVLKNSKTSEKKYIKIPLIEPQLGDSLDQAICIEDSTKQVKLESEDELKSSHKNGVHQKLDEEDTGQELSQGTVSEMTETRNILNKKHEEWSNKFEQLLAKEAQKQ